jgi:F-type H+-transporting ATPase subunit gamma
MPSLIDLRRRVRAVKNTQQITKAMKMVAASKLRRAQERIMAARPYAVQMQRVLRRLATRVDPSLHPLLAERPRTPGSRTLVIVVTSDKGLCGSFNTNVIKGGATFVVESGERCSLGLVGRKGRDYFGRRGFDVAFEQVGLFQKLKFQDAQERARIATETFVNGEYDRVMLVYNEFKSVMSQIVRRDRILPISRSETALADAAASGGPATEYIYEPDPETILAKLLPRYLEFSIFRMLLESAAAEHGARMTAMESATKNAGEMIDSLTLTYNRARQARITKELIEIVSGAAALE